MKFSLRSIGRLWVLVAGLGLLGPSGSMTLADGVAPVTLNVREQESGRYLAEWRVPRQLPASAIPTPALPDSCRGVGQRDLTERSGAWLLRQAYICSEGIAGQLVGVDYPMPNAAVSTLLRVEMLSGDSFAHLLAPGERSWRVPDPEAAGVRTRFREARKAVLAGGAHFVGNGVHLALAMALLLLGGLATSVRLATAFAAGQLVAIAISAVSGLTVSAPLAEIGVAASVALLASQALRPAVERRQLGLLAAGAGLVHGLGLAEWASPTADHAGSAVLYYVLVVLGMDAVLVSLSIAGSGLRRLVPRGVPSRRLATVAAYLVGIGAVGLALGLPATPSQAAEDESKTGFQLPDLPIPDGSGATPASRRVAAPFPDAPLQNFIAVAAFEVRHEVLVRLRDVARLIELESDGDLAIDAQDDVKRRVLDLVEQRTKLAIDQRTVPATDPRVDFLTVESRGALPRPVPVVESIENAWLGVTTVYLTETTPAEVLLTWTAFDGGVPVPATVTDPEASRTVELSQREPALLWSNELSEDPTPIVTAIAVEAPVVWWPILSIVLVGVAATLCVAALRGRRRVPSIALARVAFAGAFLLAPIGNVGWTLPLSVDATPSRADAKRILARLLPNVYRAFEFPTESATYDRLALSVTGETLTQVYLEHRRGVTMEERGGARARVEAVEVVEAESVEGEAEGGFKARAVWTVGGTVTHFGHRHFRQNRYDAMVSVVPVDGHWKIRAIELLDEQRLR